MDQRRWNFLTNYLIDPLLFWPLLEHDHLQWNCRLSWRFSKNQPCWIEESANLSRPASDRRAEECSRDKWCSRLKMGCHLKWKRTLLRPQKLRTRWRHHEGSDNGVRVMEDLLWWVERNSETVLTSLIWRIRTRIVEKKILEEAKNRGVVMSLDEGINMSWWLCMSSFGLCYACSKRATRSRIDGMCAEREQQTCAWCG